MKRYINFSIRFVVFAFLLSACNSDTETRKPSGAVYDEAALKDFVLASANPDKTKALGILDSVIRDAAGDSIIFNNTVSCLEMPFGDPNSPYRNETLYRELLQAKIKSPFIDSIAKEKSKAKLFLLMQNRPGEPANDFTYITPQGFSKKLYSIQAGHTLLFFYNPECDACKTMKAALIASGKIKQAAANGNLKVLAVYTDKDESTWREHLPEMPKDWIQGRDENEYLYQNNVYDLKAIPTLYLLDENKKVVLKDVMQISAIEEALSQ